MHPGRTDHRHEQLRIVLRRARTAAATVAVLASLLAGGTLAAAGTLAASAPAAGNSVTVTPVTALLYTLTQFTVSGAAVDPDGVFPGAVAVTFNNVPVGDLEVRGDTGAFTGAFTLGQPAEGSAAVPVCGLNTVTVTAETDDAGPFTVGSATISASCAGVSVSPGLVGRQQLPATFLLTPQNFPSPDGFTLTVGGTPQAFTTTAGGGLKFTGSPSCGPHQVVLAQTFNEQAISATARITVLCPRITLAPSALALASQPATVLVTGSQFHPGRPVMITVGGRRVGSAVTGQDGNFSLPITAAGLDCGTHAVTAREQVGQGGPAVALSASAPLKVTRCARKLAIDPAVLVPGEVTHVTGTGFAPGRPVTLTWRLPHGGLPLLGTLTIAASRGGSIGGFFLVLPHDLLGARKLVATQGAVKLTASAMVDSGSQQPASGGRLVYRQ